MDRRTLVGHVLHSGVFFGLGFLARLLLAVALGKSLSPADYGVYGLVVAVVAMSTGLLPLGVHHYVLREVPGARPRDAATIFTSVTAVQVALLAGVVLVSVPLLASVPAIGALFALDRHPALLPLIATVLFVDCLVGQLARFLYARRDIAGGNVVLFLQTGAWAYLAVAAFVLGGLTLSSALALWAGALVLALAYAAWRLDVRALVRAPFEPRRFLTAVRFGVPLLSAHVLAGADWFARFLLASYHSTEAMGIYTYHQNLVLMIAAVTAPLIATPLEPHVVAAYSSGELERSGRLLTLSLRYRLVLVIPLLVVTVTWGDALIRLMARGEYVASPWLFAALAPVPVLLTLANTFERTMFLERRVRAISRCQLTAAAVQLALVLLLVPADPVHGAALALTGGYLTLTLTLWRHYRRSTVTIELALARTALATAPCLAVAWLVASAAPSPASVGVLVAAAAIVVGCYLVFASLFRVLSTAERRWLVAFVSSGGRRARAFLAGR